MTKKSFFVIYLFLGLSIVLATEVLYLKVMTKDGVEDKKRFVKITTLPDLAISTEATYIRHRSLADLFSIYKDDGSLREYFPSTFTYSHSGIINAN